MLAVEKEISASHCLEPGLSELTILTSYEPTLPVYHSNHLLPCLLRNCNEEYSFLQIPYTNSIFS